MSHPRRSGWQGERLLTLTARRRIHASAERLFDAWTQPEHVLRWWGPAGVTCIGAEIDLAVGRPYRIGNRMPDGSTLWIVGIFETIEPPHRLVYSWQLEGSGQSPERVTVRFESVGAATDVIVTHERIADAALRKQHERGWIECLEGLAQYAPSPAPS